MREERVGGSKTPDDTVRTLFDLLFGRRQAVSPQPKLNRSGFSFVDRKVVEDSARTE